MTKTFAADLPRVAKTNHGLLIERNSQYRLAQQGFTWLDICCGGNAHQRTMQAYDTGTTVSSGFVDRLLAECPTGLIDVTQQRVAAFGVTFKKSEVARDEEFKSGGNVGALSSGTPVATATRQPDTPYTRVGPRGNPAELFPKALNPVHLFKAGDYAGIRSVQPVMALIEGKVEELPPWNVHEPEVATVVDPDGNPVAFGKALDMSDRRDEGISPLLLTKAKIFWHCAGFGNWFVVPENPAEFWKTITLRSWVERSGKRCWPIEGEPDTMSTSQCRRPLAEFCLDLLDAGFVGDGISTVFMSGTGIVPALGDTFSLLEGDQIFVESPQLGSMTCGVKLVPRPRRLLDVTAA